MNADDTLYGRIKNGVLTISGNNSRITVDGGCLSISDGAYEQSATLQLRRANCPLSRIVVTRPDGIISFAAIKWLRGIGAGLVQLDWDGTVLLATTPAGTDQPDLRRAQALAAGTKIGYAITREILRGKLHGQAAVARLLGSIETGELILRLSGDLDNAADDVRLRAIEAVAAGAYWSLWIGVPVRFARRHHTPEHWQTFGGRQSKGGGALRAVSPGNAALNYIYAVAISELTIALTGAGLDPGLGVFHADRARRPSLAYDAVEILRPYVDGWFAAWLSTACFSKRDFYEEGDGTIRLTRPLTSHLAMTAAIWRAPAQSIADWLARVLLEGRGEHSRLPVSLPALAAPKRTWQGLEPPVVKTCHDCGKVLPPKRLKFCSEACSISFHVATTTAAELTALPNLLDRGGSSKNRRHFALRRAWDAENMPGEGLSREPNPERTKKRGSISDELRDWYLKNLAPRIAQRHWAEIQRATGFSKRYAFMLRQGYVPHPRHYSALATLVRVKPPTSRGP